jgi:hypothetical protein
MSLRRPYGTPDSIPFAFPTLKRGANDRCAYLAVFRRKIKKPQQSALSRRSVQFENSAAKSNSRGNRRSRAVPSNSRILPQNQKSHGTRRGLSYFCSLIPVPCFSDP